MTCIIGFTERGEKNKMVLVSDSRTTYGNGVFINENRFRNKIFKKDNFIIGCSGTALLNQVIKYNFDIPTTMILDDVPDSERGEMIKAYLAGTFVPELVTTLEEHALIKTREGLKNMVGKIIVGYAGEHYVLDSNFCIVQPPRDYAIIGSGAPYAYGALAVLDLESKEENAKKAIEIAGEHRNSVGGAIRTLTLEF